MESADGKIITITYPERTKEDEVVRLLVWLPGRVVLKSPRGKLVELNRRMREMSGTLAYSGIIKSVNEHYYCYIDISPVRSSQETKEVAYALAVVLHSCLSIQPEMHPCESFQAMKHMVRKAKLDCRNFLPATLH